MDQFKSILLLSAMLISLAPWSLLDLCPNHPNGHKEKSHRHGSCSEGMMGDNEEEKESSHQLAFKSSPCTILAPATDEYETNVQIKPSTADQFIIVAVLFEVIKWELPEQEFYPEPDPLSNSDPPLGINALRGPPFTTPLT